MLLLSKERTWELAKTSKCEWMVLGTRITHRNLTKFTVFFIFIARMSQTDFLCWHIVDFLTAIHNIMIHRFEIFHMARFTLGTQIAWTWFTIVLCVSRTIRTLMYYIRGSCCVHDGSRSQIHSLLNENKMFCFRILSNHILSKLLLVYGFINKI